MQTTTAKAPKRAPAFTTDHNGEPIVHVPLATGETATLDRGDWDRLAASGVSPNWTCNPNGHGASYVRVGDASLRGKLAIISRRIMDAQPGEMIRYRDGNRLNLRRANLKRQGTPKLAVRGEAVEALAA